MADIKVPVEVVAFDYELKLRAMKDRLDDIITNEFPTGSEWSFRFYH